MPREYTPEQTWKLFEKIPEDLKEAIFSVEVANDIYNICEKNEIEEVSKMAKIVGNVMLGLLSPDNLKETLEKELNLKSEKAQKITQEIDRFIFYPIKESLNNLYGLKTKVNTLSDESAVESKIISLKGRKISRKDTYREPVEEK